MEKKTIFYRAKSILALTGLAISIVLVLSLFQYLIGWIETFLEIGIPSTPLNVFLYGLGIVLLSFLEYLLLTPTFGKGNVASLLVLLGRGERVPLLKGLLSVFLCCLISFLIGVPLGGEGPSVFLGALLGEGLFLWSKDRRRIYRTIMIGASTGFSVAFLNPLAGFFYYLDHQKRKKPVLLVEGAYVLLLSYFGMALVRFIEGKEDVFHYSLFQTNLVGMQTYEHNMLFLLVPVFAFILAVLFKKSVLSIRNTWKPDYRIVCVLSTVFALVFVLLLKFCGYQDLLGIGTNIIHRYPSLGMEDALVFLFLRYVFTVFAFDSFYAGGQVLPTLAIGYLLGLLLSALLKNVAHLDSQEETLFALITMLTFYASVSDSYLTSLALSCSFGPFETMVLPSLVTIAIVFLMDRYVFNTKSLSHMIVDYDRRMDKSEPKLTY